MTDYQAIKKTYRQTNRISKSVVDDFFIYYAARRDKLDREAEKQLTHYSHITCDLSDSALPKSYHQQDQIVLTFAEFLDDHFESDALRAQFRIEYAENTYQLSPEGWDEFPHFSVQH